MTGSPRDDPVSIGVSPPHCRRWARAIAAKGIEPRTACVQRNDTCTKEPSMTFAISQATSNNGVQTPFFTPDLQQLIHDVARMVTSDPGGAAQFVRDLMPSLPDASNRELASSVTAKLDDPTLRGLSQTPPGRDLLNVLGTHPHEQLGRIRDALFSVAQGSANWVNQVAQQIAHPGLRNAGDTARSDAAGQEQV